MKLSAGRELEKIWTEQLSSIFLNSSVVVTELLTINSNPYREFSLQIINPVYYISYTKILLDNKPRIDDILAKKYFEIIDNEFYYDACILYIRKIPEIKGMEFETTKTVNQL